MCENVYFIFQMAEHFFVFVSSEVNLSQILSWSLQALDGMRVVSFNFLDLNALSAIAMSGMLRRSVLKLQTSQHPVLVCFERQDVNRRFYCGLFLTPCMFEMVLVFIISRAVVWRIYSFTKNMYVFTVLVVCVLIIPVRMLMGEGQFKVSQPLGRFSY